MHGLVIPSSISTINSIELNKSNLAAKLKPGTFRRSGSFHNDVVNMDMDAKKIISQSSQLAGGTIEKIIFLDAATC